MEETVESLQEQRKALLEKISGLGPFRRGTVSVIYRKCGKPTCWCAGKGEKGHGPQYFWNGTVKGKSFGRNLHLGPEVEKYIKETERYQEFLALCEGLVEVNEKISEKIPMREVGEGKELEELKKKLQKRLQRKRRRS